MTLFHQKHQILASLDSMDQGQTEKVLEYIKSIMYSKKKEASQKYLKREAMKEIRQALGDDRNLSPLF
jgi:hypothetical protein